MKRLIYVTLLFVAGCRTAPTPIVTHIESDPPGARVFYSAGSHALTGAALGRQYVGTTPCNFTVPQQSDGVFDLSGIFLQKTIGVPPIAVFDAEPPSGRTNLFTKHQAFHGGATLVPADAVPSALFFDLTKP